MRSSVQGLVALAILAGVAAGARGADADPAGQAAADEARIAAWRAPRFGMFIHWGPVSIKGTEIGWSRGAQVPQAEYDDLYKQFNPTNFNATEWVSIARAAGMRYMVLVTKHHDGFCMFDTKQTDHNIMNSPFKRDVTKELSEACRAAGIGFGTYYSTCDWHHPAFPLGSPGGRSRKPNPDIEAYTQYLKNQTTELITKYGPLFTLWYDVPQEFDAKRGQSVIDLCRSLQPNIVVNNRTGARGDYETPEQRVGGFNVERPWETCMTICQQWAWKPNDAMKSLKACLDVLVQTVGGDGNLLFNVGPMPDGRIEPRQVERLKEMGQWLAQYGESVYATRGGPYRPGAGFVTTRKGNTIYVHVLKWNEDVLALPALPARIVRSSLLTGGTVDVLQTDDGVRIAVPAADRRELDTIVQLELDGPALALKPIASLATSTQGKPARASNVYQNEAEYTAEKAFDGEPETRWATDAGVHQAWVEVELGKPLTFDRIAISEAYERVRKFELQVREGEGWRTFHAGATLGEKFAATFPPVTGNAVRLNILEATDGPTIWEIAIAPAKGK